MKVAAQYAVIMQIISFIGKLSVLQGQHSMLLLCK